MKPLFGWPFRKRSTPAPGKAPPFLLNLGCGARFHPAWVNVDFVAQTPDVMPHDLRQPLPFGDGSCTAVYHSHVLEHFPRAFAPQFLQECFRLLTPGGRLRVVVPDLEVIARLYLQQLDGALAGDGQAARRYEWMTIELLDQLVRAESGGEMLRYWRQNPMPAEEFVIERMGGEVLRFLAADRARSAPPETVPVPRPPYQAPSPAAVAAFRERGEVHQWMYDRWSLRCLLQAAGFSEIQVCAAHTSRIPNFNQYGLDLNDDGSVRKPDSLFMEATKL